MYLAPPARTRSSPAMAILTLIWATQTVWAQAVNMHNNACYRSRLASPQHELGILLHVWPIPPIADFHPIGNGQQRQLQFRLQYLGQSRGRKSIDESVAAGHRLSLAQMIQLTQSLAEQPRGRMGLANPQPEIGC